MISLGRVDVNRKNDFIRNKLARLVLLVFLSKPLWYNKKKKNQCENLSEVIMDNIIDVSIPVAEVVDKHPEVLEILVELGFKPLANPLMRNTVGRKVSLKQGSKLEGTPMDKIVRTLEANGYEVIGLD